MTRERALPTAAELGERSRVLEARLREVAQANGHDPHRLRIVAITKTWPVGVARAALESGLRLLGESRVQEAEPKIHAIPDAEWHLVGRLQSNKVRRAVQAFAVIHSIDSITLLRRVEEASHDLGRAPRLLVQVNLTGSATTAGMMADEVSGSELAAALAELRAARVVGLMTIARMAADEEEARATFRSLRLLRDALVQRAGIDLPELSMGMSADAEAAAAEGATLVRIGTALFGPRD